MRSCVKKILAIDASNHGESWVINEKILTNKCESLGNILSLNYLILAIAHWPDQSKDILHVLRYFNVQQPIIGIGHSFGGGIM